MRKITTLDRRSFFKINGIMISQFTLLGQIAKALPFAFWKPPRKYALFMWGENTDGQLGVGDTVHRSSPVAVGGESLWSDINCGTTHVLALRWDGTLWAWGGNDFGQLGQGDLVHRSSPVQVGSFADWTTIAAGGKTSFAIRGGKLYGWGSNNSSSGVMGQGDLVHRSTPVQIGALTTWTAISAATVHAIGLTSNGKIWTWGRNNAGQLGQGDWVHRSSPTQVGSATNWTKVFAGNGIAAINSSGEFWNSGNDYNGFLGRGTSGSTINVLTKLGTLTNWSDAFLSRVNVYALKTSSTNKLWAWGTNNTGSLALGNLVHKSSPVLIESTNAWVDMCGGGDQGLCWSAFIKSDKSLWTAGYNGNGELGVGSNTSYSSMVQVGSATDWVSVSGSFANFMAGLRNIAGKSG